MTSNTNFDFGERLGIFLIVEAARWVFARLFLSLTEHVAAYLPFRSPLCSSMSRSGCSSAYRRDAY